jgi:hypothetical protein
MAKKPTGGYGAATGGKVVAPAKPKGKATKGGRKK